MMLSKVRLFLTATIVAALACSFTLQASAPQGWILAGSKPANYDTGVDPQAKYRDASSAYLKSKTPVEGEIGFGTLMQSFRAERYLGKKLRLTGFVKSEGVQGWAGLWMRVDKNFQVVAFDNMENRAIKGTSDWQRYEVVLSVPKDATGISFGILLAGLGTVWLNNTNFEVVESDVSTTGSTLPDSPTNLNFQN